MIPQSYIAFSHLQEIFIIAFPIFFGLLLHFSGGVRAFDTTALLKRNRKNIFRLTISIILLNVLPFGYFSIILLWALPSISEFNDITWLNVVRVSVTLALALAVIGFYRIYYSVTVAYQKKLYTSAELKQIIDTKKDSSWEFRYHHTQFLIPGLLYIAIPIGMFFILLGSLYGIVSSWIIIGGIFTSGFVIRRKFRDKIKDASDLQKEDDEKAKKSVREEEENLRRIMREEIEKNKN